MAQEGVELCFPQLFNASCRKQEPLYNKAVLSFIMLSCISLLTATLNLLVIISISHFRYIILTAYMKIFALYNLQDEVASALHVCYFRGYTS